MKKYGIKIVLGITTVGGFSLLGLREAHALASVDFAIEEICSHMMGNLGGLLMAAAGVGGIASAAFGNMKAMYSCLVTAIGAFGINSVLSLHFATAALKCQPGGGGTGGNVGTGGGTVVSRANIKESEVSRFNPEKAAKGFIAATNQSDSEGVSSSESTEEVKADGEEDSDLDLF